MTANDDTPRSGESVSDVSNWESLGRELLREELERTAESVRDDVWEVALRAGHGEEIGPDELVMLRDAKYELKVAEALVSMLVEDDDWPDDVPEEYR